MGNSNSTLPIESCIQSVCNGRLECYHVPTSNLDTAWTKLYNLDLPRYPDIIVRPNNATEVSGAVKCAHDNGYKVQARSGGHSYGFQMDNNTWQASIGSGFRLDGLDKLLHANGGRAIAHGTCPGVGVGGHATVGGLGPMSRMWGAALDHVLEVEVVTANGTVVRANEEQHQDLFWAIRGAGASFGIVTEFVLKTHPEPGSVVEYTYSFSFGEQKDMAPVFEQWQELVYDPDLDRRFSTLFIAEPLGALITGTFYGTKDEFDETGIAKKIPVGGDVKLAVVDWLGSLAHIAETTGLYLSDLATPFASKSLAFGKNDKLRKDSIDELFTYMDDTDPGTLLWFIIFNSEGGAMADTAYNATAYPHRDAIMMYQSYAIGIPLLNQGTRDFVSGVHDRIKKAAPEANTTYAGYVDVSLSREEAQWTYWGDKVPRLQEIKKLYDGSNVFLNPQSVDLP
ncbi:Glucooligosaccharide oxidase [Trichoderma citrinoviride]|uniref:Glucooligosaccharide oxidase n=1 Tax=Trichoderma citrinoviride TaxID=58853 RepID=A0A2T4BA16_9HYPO|nr:Glucooligosaccharide oxidase [Trichoderma citrinoviride]PTB66167.1 Glucooligosaccharide oxidase [Trichoderma citrinoviride]